MPDARMCIRCTYQPAASRRLQCHGCLARKVNPGPWRSLEYDIQLFELREEAYGTDWYTGELPSDGKDLPVSSRMFEGPAPIEACPTNLAGKDIYVVWTLKRGLLKKPEPLDREGTLNVWISELDEKNAKPIRQQKQQRNVFFELEEAS